MAKFTPTEQPVVQVESHQPTVVEYSGPVFEKRDHSNIDALVHLFTTKRNDSPKEEELETSHKRFIKLIKLLSKLI